MSLFSYYFQRLPYVHSKYCTGDLNHSINFLSIIPVGTTTFYIPCRHNIFQIYMKHLDTEKCVLQDHTSHVMTLIPLYLHILLKN